MKRIKPTKTMDDETFMKHLEKRHPDDLKMRFTVEPGQAERRMRERRAWETFHETIHRLAGTGNSHWHGTRQEEDDG